MNWYLDIDFTKLEEVPELVVGHFFKDLRTIFNSHRLQFLAYEKSGKLIVLTKY